MARGGSTEEPLRVAARGFVFDIHAGGPAGGAPVLLLHGFPQHAGQWSGVVPALHAAGLRTYAVDQRGYSPGARPAGVEAYRMAECVADAVSILDALDVGTAHVVGHDWGAAVGWYLAAGHPDRVATLTAVSVPHPRAMAAALATDPDQRERSAYVRLFREPEKAERLLLEDGARRLRGLFTPVDPDPYVAPLLAVGALTPPLNWYRALSRSDLAGAGPVAVPTTYLWSDRDRAIGPTAAQACAEHVTADYRFVPLAGVSHWVPDEVPDTVAAEVIARTAGVSTDQKPGT